MAAEITKVGKYKVLSKLAEGGMGAIYRATHPTLRMDVILKRLTMDANLLFVERFKREAKISLHLKNDHIVQVYDHFKTGTSYYMVMEYVDGQDLEHLLKERRYFSNEAAILIFAEICKGLHYAHENGVIHRDIKPANILISRNGQVKIADFGISRLKDSDERELTKAGMSFGTPSYMSPEQFQDTKTVDHRADIYSMGVLLYEMVTGKRPFPGTMTPSILKNIEKGKYVRPRKLNPRIAPVIQKVIRRAMHHNSRKRFQDLSHIIALFSKHLRKYRGQKEINDAIRRIVYEPDEIPAKAKRRWKIFRRISIGKYLVPATAGLAFIAGALALVIWRGWHYEYLFPDEYGLLKLQVNIGKSSKSPDEIYIKAWLNELYDGKPLRQPSDSAQDMAQARPLGYAQRGQPQSNMAVISNFNATYDSTDASYSFTSRELYFKSGAYALILVVENEQHQESFFIYPRNFQKTRIETIDGRLIHYTATRSPHYPLDLRYDIFNRDDGTAITGAELFITHQNSWVEWKEFRQLESFIDLFVTAKAYSFKATKPGYHDELVTVEAAPYQSVLDLNLCMVPLPGRLNIQSNHEGLRLLINNSPYYFTGGFQKVYRPIEPTTDEVRTLTLSPGEYFLTAVKDKLLSEDISNTEKIILEAGQLLRAQVNYHEDTQSISINVQEENR